MGKKTEFGVSPKNLKASPTIYTAWKNSKICGPRVDLRVLGQNSLNWPEFSLAE